MDTLVRDPFHEAVPGFFGLSLEELLAQKHPTAWLEFERGERTPSEYYAEMFDDRRAFDHTGFEARVRDAYAWVPGMEALVERLARRGVEMHALSNYPIWYRMLDERLGLSRFVKWSFVSCETGIRKPDARAFIGALDTLGKYPEQCIFIDDRPKNCEAAREQGMVAIVFESAPQVERALIEFGVLTSR